MSKFFVKNGSFFSTSIWLSILILRENKSPQFEYYSSITPWTIVQSNIVLNILYLHKKVSYEDGGCTKDCYTVRQLVHLCGLHITFMNNFHKKE